MRTLRSSVGALTALGALLAGVATCSHDVAKSKNESPAAPGPAPDDAAARAVLASAPLGSVVLRDAQGTGRFVAGAARTDLPALSLSAESAARLHLERHAGLLGVNDAAVRDAVVTGSHALAGGAGVVQFGQRLSGIEVFRARASVVLDASKHLVSIASALPPASVVRVPKLSSFRLRPEAALAKAYAARWGSTLPASAIQEDGPRGAELRGYVIATPVGAPRVLEATAKRVFFPEGDAFVPAYHVELVARADHENQGHAWVVAADDGRILYESSLTQNEAFTYRVWAEPTGNHIPTDGPMVDYTPSPSGIPDKAVPAYMAPILVSMEGFNKNAQGAADPWLAATDTFTFGNNVRAYSDRDNYVDDAGVRRNDGYDAAAGDIRADITSAKTFDRIYDVTKPPEVSADQIKAAVTQLFYVNNWLHDYWYDSGFNEASGNAQLSNYGRGGVEGDPLRAEAQDGADFGQANNANMSTPSDGMAPRMQMFVWTGMPNRKLDTTPALTFTDGLGAAGFGPQTFDVSGTVVLSDDGSTAVVPPTTGTGTTTDGCQLPTNVSGKIAVIDRGSCPFTLKAKNAQTAGAIGVIIVNNAAGRAPSNPGGTDVTITVPLLGLSLEDGQPLKQALASGSVSAHVVRGDEVKHDGTIDNTVVAHEWGHYLHHRLVVCGGPSCGGMSEGFADFDALMMVVRDGDTFDNKTYALSQYATAGLNQNAAYFGIRRAPYSTDMAKNPFTFQHVRKMSMLPMAPLAPASPDMSEVHNVGEIWAQTLFDAYVNLINAGKMATPARTFEETKRRMADYIVAGMKAAPTEPTMIEQRDAMLATVLALGRMDDFAALAKGFAKRGLGSGATAPSPFSLTLDEAVENFDMKGSLAIVDAKIDDSVRSCDRDGNLDAGESGKLTVRVRNAGWATLTKTEVKVSSTDTNVTFADGGTATIKSLDPYGVATVSIGVSASDAAAKRTLLPITVTLSDPDAVAPTADKAFPALFNFDDKASSSAADDVESNGPAWTRAHGAVRVPEVWSRAGDGSNHVWHGADLPITSDESLVSPDLVVSAGSPFVIAFSHRYSFEKGPAVAGGPDVFFDGGVLEISADGGTTWNDVSTYSDPGYPRTLYKSMDEPNTNELAGRKAWGGDSAGYPSYLDAAVNLGTKLAGKTVKVRFRIGTDPGGSAAGWDIDNVSFSGITNTPFPSLVDDATTCSDAGTSGDGGADDGGVDAPASDAGASDASREAGAPDSGRAGADAGPPGAGPEDSGCSCSTIGRRSARSAIGIGLLGGLLLMFRRRRRRAD